MDAMDGMNVMDDACLFADEVALDLVAGVEVEEGGTPARVIPGFGRRYWITRSGEVFDRVRKGVGGSPARYRALSISTSPPRVRLKRPGCKTASRPRVNTLVEEVWGAEAAAEYKDVHGVASRRYENGYIWAGFKEALGIDN